MSDNTRRYQPLPHTAPLEWEGDLAARMVGGLRAYMLRQTEAAPARRARRWKTGARAVAAKRRELRRLIGAVDERLPPALQLLSDPSHPGPLAQCPGYQVWAVRWPVVVCQHGLEGRPQDLADPKVESHYYHRYACRLAEQGFVTFSPQNPYIGGETYRVLQRLANPLKLSLFSFIIRQHQRLLEWLSSLPFVDPKRLAFYGLSYGGKTAMRVPAILDQYCLSICSADYNEWIWKNVSVRHPYSYMFHAEYEMPEFDLGNTFNYAEMSWLIFPRPFMVERGHHDGVAPDEWVAYEFARTKRRYVLSGLGERAQIEFFDGPHTINGQGTFRFLEEQLSWEGAGVGQGQRGGNAKRRRGKPTAHRSRRV